MKARLLAGMLGFLGLGAFAYWIDMPLQDLAAQSDCVVIGRVIRLQPNTNTLRVQVTMNELLVLKGIEPVGDTITFDAPYTLHHCVQFHVKANQVAQPVKPSVFESNGVVSILHSSSLFGGNLPDTVLKPSSWRSNELVVTHLDSFRTGETCAVLLRKDPEKLGALRLVTDDDGKFYFDPGDQRLNKSVTGYTNFIPLETFSTIVKTSTNSRFSGVTIFTIPPTLGPFVPLTNLPISLVLPRAVTR
jgi:hypothetical protein